MIGLERGKVRVVRSALGDRALGIEHVGSTAIEGMVAKPLIDLMVGIEDIRAAYQLIPALERIGYGHREAREHRESAAPPEYLLCVKGPENRRTHHIRLSQYRGTDWTAQLLFRDYLRTHPEAAEGYARHKRELAERYPDDRAAYNAGKEELIRRVLQLAQSGV